jgi:cyanate permease
LIGAIGWRSALATLGIIALVTLVPLAFLIRQPPKTPVENSSGYPDEDEEPPVPLSANVTTAWLSIAVIFCCICMSVPLMHLVPLVQDRGYSLEDAGSVIFVMLLVAIAGRVFFGKLADIIGAIPAYTIASAWQTVLVFGFVQFEALNAFYIFAIIYGFGYSGVMTGILVCVRALTPLSTRASALGIVSLFGWVGHGIGGFQGGYFFDLTSNYTLSYANAALAGIINLVIVGSLFITINRRRTALLIVN